LRSYRLNQFLEWSFEKEFYEARKPIKFSAKEKKQNNISLSIAEFLTLFNADLSEKHLDIARDLFCFMCVTGMRYSATQNLTWKNVKSEGIFYMADKSKKDTLTPNTIYSQKIIEKYKGNDFLLPQMKMQNFNENIKQLFDKLNFDRIVEKTDFKGAKTKHQHFKLSEVISSKLAKKTFISLLCDAGFTSDQIGIVSANTKDTIGNYQNLNQKLIVNNASDTINNFEKM